MSKADEIIVDFNLVKREINNEELKEVKPKAKRISKTNNIVVEDVNPVEPVEPVEEPNEPEPVEEVIKPKAKRASKKNDIVVEDVKPVIEEPIQTVEEVKPNKITIKK